MRLEAQQPVRGQGIDLAAYEHLPIFKAMVDVTVFVENTVKFFSRYHKYTLGSELRTMCHGALALIMEANSLRDKGSALMRLRVLLERIKIHLVIARETKAFHKPNTFLQLAEKVVNVSRQNEGWLKSTGRGSSPSAPAPQAHRVLGLRRVTGLRGFREGCGFHRRHLARFLNMALDAGRHVALIRAERGLDGVVNRRLAKVFRGCEPAGVRFAGA